jgi:hypothetical protein
MISKGFINGIIDKINQDAGIVDLISNGDKVSEISEDINILDKYIVSFKDSILEDTIFGNEKLMEFIDKLQVVTRTKYDIMNIYKE